MNDPTPKTDKAQTGQTQTGQAPPWPDRLDAVLFDAGMTLIGPTRKVEQIYALHASPDRPPTPELLAEIRRHFRELFNEARQHMASGADGYVASDEADRALWRDMCLSVAQRIPGLTPDPEAWFETLYAEFGRTETWQCFPDTWPALQGLAERRVPMGVVSNWDSRLLGILEGLGLSALMGTVLISATEGVRKPGPEIFARALAILGVSPERTLMVGDSVIDDVDGAWALGMPAVLIHRRADIPVPDGIPCIETLTELLSWPNLGGQGTLPAL